MTVVAASGPDAPVEERPRRIEGWAHQLVRMFEPGRPAIDVLEQIPGAAQRLRAALLALWAAIMGAAPHVLHHVGPLAGTALVAGVGGRVLFGVAGFVATFPLLRRLRRRTGSWRVPGLALATFVAIYMLSTLVVGPAIGNATSPDAATPSPVQLEMDHHGHDVTGD